MRIEIDLSSAVDELAAALVEQLPGGIVQRLAGPLAVSLTTAVEAAITEVARGDEGSRPSPTWRLVSIPEAARTLGVSARTVRDMISAGELPSVTVRASRRVHSDDLAAYVAARRDDG